MGDIVLIGGAVSFTLLLIGIFFAVQESRADSFHIFDYFFLAAIVLTFGLANYLWFVAGSREVGKIVAIWVVGNVALGLYFRSVYTRYRPNA